MESTKAEVRMRVLVAAEFPLVRGGMLSTLQAASWLTIAGEAGTAAETRSLCLERHPDFLVLDLEMAGGDGLGLVRECAALHPGMGILAYSEREEEAWLRRVFAAGARACISKRDVQPELTEGLCHLGRRMASLLLDEVTSGRERVGRRGIEALSNRELAVLRGLGRGQNARKVAEDLGVAVTTVETHVHRIKAKLLARDGEELRRLAACWTGAVAEAVNGAG